MERLSKGARQLKAMRYNGQHIPMLAVLVMMVGVGVMTFGSFGADKTLSSRQGGPDVEKASAAISRPKLAQVSTSDSDLNTDGSVDLIDLRILGKNWLLSGREDYQGDLDANNTVNVFDLRALDKVWSGLGARAVTPGGARFDIKTSPSQAASSVFNVHIYANSLLEPVDTVGADILYNPTQLQFVTASNSQSFQLCVSPKSTAGKVSFGCTMPGNSAVTGRQFIGTASFKVLKDKGDSAVAIGSDSQIIRSTDGQGIWNRMPTAASVKLTKASGEVGEAIIKNNPAIALRVVKADGSVAANQAVYVADKTSVTDSTGVASFTNLRPGKHAVTLANGVNISTIQVGQDDSPQQLQEFRIALASVGGSKFNWPLLAVALPLLFVVGWLGTRRRESIPVPATQASMPDPVARVITVQEPLDLQTMTLAEIEDRVRATKRGT